MNGQDLQVEVEVVDSEVQAFKQPQAAAVEKLHHEIAGSVQLLDDPVDFLPGQDNWNIWLPLRSDYTVQAAELSAQDMPEEEEQGIEGLIL